jgi:hypothetical protein
MWCECPVFSSKIWNPKWAALGGVYTRLQEVNKRSNPTKRRVSLRKEKLGLTVK